jgi:hypothetical protein
MVHRVLSVTVALCAAVWLVSFPAFPVTAPAFAQALAQSSDAKPAEAPPAASNQEPAKESSKEPSKEPQKIDEFAEAQRLVAGPAGNPECVWFGRRVVGLLWRDDLDTAFRHLDLYDRFGCPSGHIQAAFRCLLLHATSIDPKAADPKAADTLNSKVNACWINPSLPPAPAPTPGPAAAAPSSSAAH